MSSYLDLILSINSYNILIKSLNFEIINFNTLIYTISQLLSRYNQVYLIL